MNKRCGHFQKCILIFCAHSDDEAIGMAGTIAKFANEGFYVVKVVMSYGELSKPHFKEEIVIKERVEETEAASAFIGIKKTIFIGMRDAKIKEDIQEAENVNMIKNIILHYKPDKIFLPSAQDPHPDHQAVYKGIISVLKEIKLRKKIPVYAFEVWNIMTEEKPAVYEDITNYFKKKIRYIKMFKSQWVYMYLLLVPAYFRARRYGRRIGVKYAEKFYRVM